jgi:PhoPQ-activated pathogenicity-related protein
MPRYLFQLPDMKLNLNRYHFLSVMFALGVSSLRPDVSAANPNARVPNGTALDRYVYTDDPHYGYQLVKTFKSDQSNVHVLEMTSQKWLTEAEVDRPIWKHWMIVVVPPKVVSDSSLLLIGGGSNKSGAPNEADERLVQVAQATGSVVTELKMVPNQPLVFAGDGEERVEDAMIAYTWDKYLRTGDEKWPARLPMTKAAVRAMDTVSDFCASEAGGRLDVKQFVVAGGSKRGWTTWTTGAVDRRVRAIFPIVIDMLNVIPSFKHHFSAYGFYAPAVGNYESMGIMEWQDSPEYKNLMKIVEPYEYRDRLTEMPKFIINACGDQFFLPDSWRFYFDELEGPKNLRYVPNGEHSLRETDAWETLMAGYFSVIHGVTIPEIAWGSPSPGHLIASAKGMRPKAVKVWVADNPDARDFRVDTIGRSWKAKEVKASDATGLTYEVKVEGPEKGWRAFVLEFTFKDDKVPLPLKTTTGVYVIPDTLPHGEKAGNL